MKVGDYVRCIKDDGYLKKGEVSRIDSIEDAPRYPERVYYVKKQPRYARVLEPVKVAVHCKSEEEWDRVKSRSKNNTTASWSNTKVAMSPCLYLHQWGGWDREIHCLEQGYHIISAQEYLKGELTANTTGDEATITINQSEGDNKMNQDILKEFGDEKGTTLVNVNEYLTDIMIKRYVMKTYRKEIIKECNAIEAQRLAANKD